MAMIKKIYKELAILKKQFENALENANEEDFQLLFPCLCEINRFINRDLEIKSHVLDENSPFNQLQRSKTPRLLSLHTQALTILTGEKAATHPTTKNETSLSSKMSSFLQELDENLDQSIELACREIPDEKFINELLNLKHYFNKNRQHLNSDNDIISFMRQFLDIINSNAALFEQFSIGKMLLAWATKIKLSINLKSSKRKLDFSESSSQKSLASTEKKRIKSKETTRSSSMSSEQKESHLHNITYTIDILRKELLEFVQDENAYYKLVEFYNKYDISLCAYQYFILLNTIQNKTEVDTLASTALELQMKIRDLLCELNDQLSFVISSAELGKSTAKIHALYKDDLVISLNLTYVEHFNKNADIETFIKNFLVRYHQLTNPTSQVERNNVREKERDLLLELKEVSKIYGLTEIYKKVVRILDTADKKCQPTPKTMPAPPPADIIINDTLIDMAFIKAIEDATPPDPIVHTDLLVALEPPISYSSSSSIVSSTNSSVASEPMEMEDDPDLQEALRMSMEPSQEKNRIDIATLAKALTNVFKEENVSMATDEAKQTPGGP